MVRPITDYDMFLFYKGQLGHPFIDFGDFTEMMKSAGAVSTATTGIFNAVYGGMVWSQLNEEANVFGCLPKGSWPRSGWRVQTDFGTTTSSALGITETDVIPDPVHPDIELVKATPKIQVESLEVSDIVEALIDTSVDDMWGDTRQIRTRIGTEFAKHMNKQLMAANTGAAGAGNCLESIDRIVGSYAEKEACSDITTVNIYDIDRDTAASWADAAVNHNSGVDRDLTIADIRETLKDARVAAGNTNLIITGHDTMTRLQGLHTSFMRYGMGMENLQVQFGVNGIRTAKGIDGGLKISAFENIPIIVSDDVPKDTISRMYFLDTTDPEGFGQARLGMSIVRPVEYYESHEYLLIGKFAAIGAYRLVGETTARFLPGQAKLRDLK